MVGMGSHQRGYCGKSIDWVTPRWIIERLGGWRSFDLDPCAAMPQPWRTARRQWTRDGLDRRWAGRVWLNPPYGPHTAAWLERLAKHGRGTALIFARTESRMFHEFVWRAASGLLFLRGRLYFFRPNGDCPRANAGAPSVLVAYGRRDAAILARAAFDGQFVPGLTSD